MVKEVKSLTQEEKDIIIKADSDDIWFISGEISTHPLFVGKKILYMPLRIKEIYLPKELRVSFVKCIKKGVVYYYILSENNKSLPANDESSACEIVLKCIKDKIMNVFF